MRHDDDRDARSAHDAFGDAAQDQPRDTGAAVTAEDDIVGADFTGEAFDCIDWLAVDQARRNRNARPDAPSCIIENAAAFVAQRVEAAGNELRFTTGQRRGASQIHDVTEHDLSA